MATLTKRIESLEQNLETPIEHTTYDLLGQRVGEALNDNLEYRAVNSGVRWAFLAGPDLVERALGMLDAVGLTERLLGAEITRRLRAGEDGRTYTHVVSPEDGESMRALAIGGIRYELLKWIIELQAEWRGDAALLIELVRAFDRDKEQLVKWTGDCPAAPFTTKEQ